MTWFLVDDGFSEHAKVDALGADQAAAVACWTLCGVACSRSLTNGVVTHPLLLRTLALWTEKDRTRAVKALVRVGLWHDHHEGGWVFHEWLAWQQSREEVLHKRALAAERQRRKRQEQLAKTYADVTGAVTQPVTRDNGVSHAHSSRPLSSPLPSSPLPSDPLSRSEGAREPDAAQGFRDVQHLGHLLREHKRLLGKAWAGEAGIRAVWDGGGLRVDRGRADEAAAILEWANLQPAPADSITRALQGFAVDAFAQKSGRSMSLFARDPGRYLRASVALSSAPSGFDDAPPDDAPLPACLGGPD